MQDLVVECILYGTIVLEKAFIKPKISVNRLWQFFSIWRQEISLISGVKVRQLQQFAVTFELHFYQHMLLEWARWNGFFTLHSVGRLVSVFLLHLIFQFP